MNKRNVSWNFIGTMVYSLITILLATIVKRWDGGEADAFTFDFKLAQLLLTVGYFEVRVYQVTDSRGKYRFSDYLGFRIITCAAMMAGGLVYFIFSGKSWQAAPLLLLLCAYKMLDALADSYEGDYQKNERIDISGQSMTLRTLVAAVAFCLVIIVTGNAVWAAAAMVVASAVIVAVYNPSQRKAYGKAIVRPTFDRMGALAKDTVLLALGAFVCTYLLNCASYAMDGYASEYNYIFGALFMPASLINLVATVLYKPMLTTWNHKHDEKDYAGFLRLFWIFAGLVVLLTLACMLGGYLIGLPVLSAVYAVDLLPYRTELLVLLAGGGCNALCILIYYGLVVMRCQRYVFGCYIITLLLTAVIPFYFVKQAGIAGASWAFLLIMTVQCVVFAALFFIRIRKEKNNENH